MKNGIYVIEAHDGNHVDIVNRYVVIAETATAAAEIAAGYQWPSATKKQADSMIEDRLDIGRVGDYDPGITGARMTIGSIVAVQRSGQR